MAVSPAAFSVPAPAPAAAASPQEALMRARIDKTAKAFETSFLSVMINEMFEGVATDGPFGGGQAEASMRSFMTEAFAKSMSERGGVGLAPSIREQMLKMQGLS